MNYTACTRRNRLSCKECDEVIESRELKRTVKWGFWDDETQNFEDAARQEHYCESCWREEFDRDAAAHYEVEDAQRLWDILEAADGNLVADLRPIFFGGQPWIRVVNGDLQAIRATKEMDRRADPPILKFGSEPVDVDREWFDETFDAERDLPDDSMPTIVLLKPADETPFADYEALPDDQRTFDEVDETA